MSDIALPDSSPIPDIHLSRKAVQMAIVHTKGDAWYAWGIMKVTGGSWNHSLIKFIMDEGEDVYFESYWKKDVETKKTGVHGPIPFDDLLDWEASSKKRSIVSQLMPYGPKECQKAYDLMMKAKLTIKYTKYQLWRNFLTCVFGMGMRRSSGTPNRWTCSECVARAWAEADPEAVLKYLKIGEIKWDMVTPSGKTYGLKEAVDSFLGVQSLADEFLPKK